MWNGILQELLLLEELADPFFLMYVFQVQDLAVASPATVSRCGMVYIDPDELKWMPYVQTWISGLKDKVAYYSLLS